MLKSDNSNQQRDEFGVDYVDEGKEGKKAKDWIQSLLCSDGSFSMSSMSSMQVPRLEMWSVNISVKDGRIKCARWVSVVSQVLLLSTEIKN